MFLSGRLWYNESGKAGFIEKRLSGQRPFLPLCGTIVFLLGIYFYGILSSGKNATAFFIAPPEKARTEPNWAAPWHTVV